MNFNDVSSKLALTQRQFDKLDWLDKKFDGNVDQSIFELVLSIKNNPESLSEEQKKSSLFAKISDILAYNSDSDSKNYINLADDTRSSVLKRFYYAIANKDDVITNEEQMEVFGHNVLTSYDENMGRNVKESKGEDLNAPNKAFKYEMLRGSSVVLSKDKTVSSDNVQKSGTYIPTEKDKANASNVFGDTLYVDNFHDHNQILDYLEKLKNEGKEIPQKIVLFDSHSDIYSTSDGETIANWVNTAIHKYDLKDIYWVMPENMAKDSEVQECIQKYIEDLKGRAAFITNTNITKDTDLTKEESVQDYIMVNDKYLLPEDEAYDDDLEQKNLKRFKIHVCTESSLPDMKNEKVMMSVDMDYFSNSGYDTATDYQDNKNSEELNDAFSKFFQTLNDKNIKPTILGNCYSDDDYLPKEDFPQAQEFTNFILQASKQKEDTFDKYKHSHKMGL